MDATAKGVGKIHGPIVACDSQTYDLGLIDTLLPGQDGQERTLYWKVKNVSDSTIQCLNDVDVWYDCDIADRIHKFEPLARGKTRVIKLHVHMPHRHGPKTKSGSIEITGLKNGKMVTQSTPISVAAYFQPTVAESDSYFQYRLKKQ